MKATVLDTREDDSGTCYLCKIPLDDYVSALPSTYQEYEIQREIVTNVYLDQLVQTVLFRRHIPPIVLIAPDRPKKNGRELEIRNFKILDGLQRTFRLQAIRQTLDFFLTRVDDKEDYLSWNKFKFSRAFSSQLRELNSNTDVLRAILEFRKKEKPKNILDSFADNYQWFEVWEGLSVEDEVKKMLTLNAGHKPVKTRHQLELLFLNLLPMLREVEGGRFQLVREKEISATQFSKARDVGKFHFAHILTSLLSFGKGEPVAVSTGLIQSIQSGDEGVERYEEFTSPDFLRAFVSFLVQVDTVLAKQYPDNGVQWFGRETSLAGLFGALGWYVQHEEVSAKTAMRKFADAVKDHSNLLNLEQFERQRNSVDLAKVNIGNVNRNAVFGGVREILSRDVTRVDWRKHFNVED